jgi:hypothetical protein
MGFSWDKKGIPELKALHHDDPDPKVKLESAVALIRLGESGYLEFVRRAMEQASSLSDKISIADQLASVGDASGYEYVKEACNSGELAHRKLCAIDIGRFADLSLNGVALESAVLEQVLDLLGDPDEVVRELAGEKLKAFSIWNVIPGPGLRRLEALAASSSYPEVQAMARAALERQKERASKTPEKRP